MTANLSLVEAPASAVTLADAKAFLHVWHADDDDVITQLIAAATDKLDGADGMLGRCLAPQTWRLSLDEFPDRAIRLPLPPFREVVSIKYADWQGVDQTLPETAYHASSRGFVVPTSSWPRTADIPDAVTIRFKAGYDDVPPSLKQVILGLVFFWYAQRGTGAQPNSETVETPFGFDDALTQWRVPFVG